MIFLLFVFIVIVAIVYELWRRRNLRKSLADEEEIIEGPMDDDKVPVRHVGRIYMMTRKEKEIFELLPMDKQNEVVRQIRKVASQKIMTHEEILEDINLANQNR